MSVVRDKEAPGRMFRVVKRKVRGYRWLPTVSNDPLPDRRKEGEMEQCPFCKHEVPVEATVCANCHAMKGYGESNGRVLGYVETLFVAVIVPGAAALLFFVGWVMAAGPGVYWPLYVSAFFSVLTAVGTWRLRSGPRWYRQASVG